MPLCALSEDALVAVLLTLAPPSSSVCDDWVFVALTCRALWAAVVRAVREAEHRAICHWRLPGANTHTHIGTRLREGQIFAVWEPCKPPSGH